MTGVTNFTDIRIFKTFSDHPLDPRDIKARLELPVVSFYLANGIPIVHNFLLTNHSDFKNSTYFTLMSDEDIQNAVRVAVECGIYWRLKEYGILTK